MAELTMNQHNTEILFTTDIIDKKNKIKDHRIHSESFLTKVAQCIKTANTIHTNYGIDILETNGSFEITDKVIDRLDYLSSIYFPNNKNNNADTFSNSSEQHDKYLESTTINYNEMMITKNHIVPIKLPPIIEMQLRNNRLLREAINDYRRHERCRNLLKNKKSTSINSETNKEEEDEQILMIEAESLCPIESNTTHDSLPSANLTQLMKQSHNQCKNKINKKKNRLINNIKTILNHIINEEIIYEYTQNEIQSNHKSKSIRKIQKNKNQIIQLLPYENTYGQFYYPYQFQSIEPTMIEKIINGVQSMASTLTNTKDAEDVLNSIVLLADHSSSSFTNKIADELMKTIQKRFITHKQGDITHHERIHVRTALDLIFADNRLNGITTICRSESLILSCMLRKILKCIQIRMLCSYADVITTLNESDSHQIHLRTFKRISLSSDEFIEIIGEMYNTSYETIETMKYYLEANDIIDMNTNLIHSSIKISKQIDEMIKYIFYEDAIRLLLKLIVDRKHMNDNDINNEYKQFKLNLPIKLNELYQSIKKLNAFMSTSQVLTAIRGPYLSQLAQRSKVKPITVNELRAIISQIWLLPENFDTLITENTITSEVLCRFYTDFHEKEDIDERLNKISKKIHDHLNLHSCITRVAFKMVAEHSNGTSLTPYLDEFNRIPRFISIFDIFDDLINSGLISTTELIVYSKQDIIIKKSSLLKHFQRISFIRKHDADLLAEITLIIREDTLIDYLTQRAMIMKQAYINCILNNTERQDFITKNRIKSTNRLSSLSIHKFIRYFNLDPNCGKIFFWMGLTDENIVKTLIETKTFVNEYMLDGIYNNFLTRLHDTLESGIYNISAENLLNFDQQNGYLIPIQRNSNCMVYKIDSKKLCKLGCYLTYEQASILVDFADPQYEHALSSLITIHDIISQEDLKSLLTSNNYEINLDEISKLILHKQQVIECKILLESFHQRINYRQKRFKRVENLQKLLLESLLFNEFIEMIANLGVEYFTRTELDYLEEIKLIDIGILALLLTLPSYNSLIHQHKYEWFHDQQSSSSTHHRNYLHILDPIIEKYSIFLTTIIIRMISNKGRFSAINEILIFNLDDYLSTEEVLKICAYEQIISHDDILHICQETFPIIQTSNTNEQSQPSRKSLSINEGTDISLWSIPDCYTRNITMYSHDPILQQKLNQTILLTIFDYILHFNHRITTNKYLRQLFNEFKPLAYYKAQLLIEKEITIIKLLLKTRQKQTTLNIHDLNRYLELYPIPCRLDIINELCHIKILSQSLVNDYVLNQCYELKIATPELQTIFLFYMMIKLIRQEGYIDEINLKKILNQYTNDTIEKKLDIINKQILRNGFLTIEQITHSADDFFLYDYFNEDTLKNQSNEYKTVIQEQILSNILRQERLTNTQFDFVLNQNIRRRQVIQTNILSDQLKHIKIVKEKVQRKVDHVLSKMDDNTHIYSKMKQISSRLTSNNLTKHDLSIVNEQQLSTIDKNITSPDLRSLRHNYIQAKIPQNQLHLLVEQGGWTNDIYLEFKRELDIIDSDNLLDLIRYITKNISLLIKQNGSVTEKPLMKYFQEHQILFLTDFQLLLTRYGMVSLEDLIDLLVVSRLAKADEIKSYAKNIFCLNINKFIEISKSHEDMLVKKTHVQNNLEKRLCITTADLSHLLNHVLKLDRLKRILDIIPTIKNYLRLHPINTFNAVKALKLEFDFNHYDMKFLRDLKLLNDTWYKRYLLSRTSETDANISELINDDDQEQEDRREFKFRSTLDEDFDFNEFMENEESQLNVNEQRKQLYLEQIKKRKDQIDLYKSKTSTDDDNLQLMLNPDDFYKQDEKKDQLRVIEQVFPDASTLESQLLLPFISDDQKRLFMQLDFAKEENIEDYHRLYHSEDKVDSKKILNDTINKESEQPLLSSDEKSFSKESEKDIETEQQKFYIDDQSSIDFESKQSVQKQLKDTQQISIQPFLEIRKSSDLLNNIPEEDDKTKLESVTINKDTPVEKEEEQQHITDELLEQPSILFVDEKVPLSIEDLHSQPMPTVLSNATEDLSTSLNELIHQMTDDEQISLKRNLKLIRDNIEHWLQTTSQYNTLMNSIDNPHQSINENEYHTNQLITYFHNEFEQFSKHITSNSLNFSKLKTIFQQRINHIENILKEIKNHQNIIQQVDKQIIEIDQMINETKLKFEIENLDNKFNKYKEDFIGLKQQEYFQIQPILRTQLELAIRTIDTDLYLIEQILEQKTVTDIIPITSLITTNIVKQPIPSKTYENITNIRDSLSKIASDIKAYEATLENKRIVHDLLGIDMIERLQGIKQEYLEQKMNEENIQDIKSNIDKALEFDQEQIEFMNKSKEVHEQLDKQSNKIQQNLFNVTTARDNSNHPNFSLDIKLKYLPIDSCGILMKKSLYLVDEQNMPLSDKLHLIRLPNESDRFQISDDSYELIIIDNNNIPLSDPITFKQLTSELIQFEYINNDQRTIQISSHGSINRSIMLNVKPLSFDKSPTSYVLFVVDNNDYPLSKPIQLIEPTDSILNISELKLSTFLYDEKKNEKVLLTPEQYLISIQQSEFTSRKFLTYIVSKNNQLLSEPIDISDIAIQKKHAIQNILSKKLIILDRERHKLFDHFNLNETKNEFLKIILNEYELMNGYVQDRLDKLKIEEKIIEQIVPILDEQYNNISIDQIEYKQEQSNMDNLVNTMKSIVQLDEKLTELRKTKTFEISDIEKLESNLIDQLIQVSNQLDDVSIIKQVENLTNHFQDTQLLTELRPIILTGIKNRAKTIQKKCETLLINIHEKSNQLKQPEQIRFEYILYLTKQFNEQIEYENDVEHFYNKIERMQYEFYQKNADSLETIELEDLDNEIKHKYNIEKIQIPDYLEIKNEKLIYKFNLILRYLNDKFKMIEQYKNDLLNEMKRFLIESIDNEYSYVQQIYFIQNEIKINNNNKLLKYIEKYKTILNKLETIDNKNLQYDFLLSKLDRLYEIILNNYQIKLPNNNTNIESIRSILNNIRKTIKKELQMFDITRNDLLRKLNVLNKKEELKQRTKITTNQQESQLSSLNAYIQQSINEPMNIHHEFYAIKIQQITNDLMSMFHIQSVSQMNLVSKTLDHLESYIENLDKLMNDNENKLKYVAEDLLATRKYSMIDSLVREEFEDLIMQQNKLIHYQQSIIKMRAIATEAFNHFQSLDISNPEKTNSQQQFKEFKQKAMEPIIQSIEYENLSKCVSPHLLLLHKFTSGQELIPSITSSSTNLLQSETKAHVNQELSFQTFLLQSQSSANFQKDSIEQYASLDLKTQVLHTEIMYLQKQHAEAIAVSDFSQQLAAEQIISTRLQRIKQSQIEIQDSTSMTNQQSVKYNKSKTSIISTSISRKSLPTNETDEQIRKLLKNHIKSLQMRIENDESKLSSIEDFRQLNKDLKKSRQENNREKQIDIQLQILNKINESINPEILQNLRQHLLEEQSYHKSHVLQLPYSAVVEQRQSTSISEPTKQLVTGELIPQIDSIERTKTSFVTTDSKELYQTLQKMKYSIEIALEGTQQTSNIVDSKYPLPVPKPVRSGISIEHDEELVKTDDIRIIRIPTQSQLQLNSDEGTYSSLVSTYNILDLTTISPLKNVDSITSDHRKLSVVGNAKKYSILHKKANDRQTATTTQRSIIQTQREYGEVYVRNRFPTNTSSVSDINEDQNNIEEKLYNKIKRKSRLVKYEKTKQGNTVIHQQVNLSTHTLLIPQRVIYEENLEPAPPLIHVNDTTNSTFNVKHQTSNVIENDYQNKKSDIKLPFHFSNILSPIQEEIETIDDIPLSPTNQDLLAEKHSTDTKDRITEFSTFSDDKKSSEKLSATQDLSSGKLNVSDTHQSIHETQQQIDENKQITNITSSVSLPNNSQILKTIKKERHESTSLEQITDEQLITNDESLSTQEFDIEQETPITPENKVIYHKVGGKLKRGKKKKTKQAKTSHNKVKTKIKKIDTTLQSEPLLLQPRKAVPFISATKNEQIDVEEDIPIKSRKKKRTRSSKSRRKRTRSKSPKRRKKKSKTRPKNQLNLEEKIDNTQTNLTNKDAIAMHLLNVKRFTSSPLSPISYDQTHHKHDDIIEKSRIKLLKPMIKNFELDHKYTKEDVHTVDAYDLDKELFDFNTDTKDINQPAMFTEYIPEFFQKQAEEKQIRRISLTAIKTDEHLSKHLAPRISRLYNGWQPSDIPCVHTDEFRPLNKYLMSDISYYFDEDFIDESGLFQNQKNFDKLQPRIKQPTQRFRDDYIVKEFFNCWKDHTTEKARIAELRRKRVTIDFREFWFQDAFSDPFYSYFEQPSDYIKKQNNHHQMAYRLHKRLIRTGREQPKETMNHTNRSSFLPLLFNLPKNHLDRQVSLARRRQQLINTNNENYLIPITNPSELLPLIRERIQFLNQTKTHINRHRDELAIEQLLINSTSIKQATIKDLDGLIIDYYKTLEEQKIKSFSTSSSNIIKLPMLKQSSRPILTITK
ncbi:unnamed protein product [Adineta steineri]|uniref:Uncharacterized protein n=1 Tax=Adineta steineri TaxID=433720 RepID=A0A815ALC8_9BILA|nr:unnamed protein product [Adineta steineri]CAF3710806.1 unnamed protein product [Adineta steineri]